MANANHHSQEPLTVVIMGASGDLARTKISPALYALYCQGYLPERLRVVGYARSEFSDDAFRLKLVEHLKCRCAAGAADHSNEFLACCSYCRGSYAWGESYQRLVKTLGHLDDAGGANRMFYLAIPPAVFLDVARAIG